MGADRGCKHRNLRDYRRFVYSLATEGRENTGGLNTFTIATKLRWMTLGSPFPFSPFRFPPIKLLPKTRALASHVSVKEELGGEVRAQCLGLVEWSAKRRMTGFRAVVLANASKRREVVIGRAKR
jgi:hypothetical protein